MLHGPISSPVTRSAMLGAVLVAIAASVTPAFAQDSGALFGRRTSNPNSRQTLDLSVSSAGSYDTDAGSGTDADQGQGLFGAQQPPGYATTLESALDYAFRGRSVQIRSTGTSAQRYFRPLNNLMPPMFSSVSQSGALQLAVGARKTRVLVSQSVMVSSSPLYSLFTASSAGSTAIEAPPATAAPAAYALNDVKSSSYGTTVTLMRQLARLSSVAANVDQQHTNMLASANSRQVLDMYGVGVRAQQGIARNTTFTAGYHYRIGTFDQRAQQATLTSRLTEHGIDLGIDYRRRLSATRMLTLGLVLGGTSMQVPRTAAALSDTVQTYSRVWAQANVAYNFARGWQANAGYRQGVDYVAALSQPVVAKSVSTGMTGQVTRRLDVLTSAAYSSGETAMTALGSVFNTYTGDARLRLAVARSFAVYAEYLYYFYDSRGTLPLVPGLPAQLERNTARVGLMLRIPAL